jgi:polysaccharide biosynthesis/export protein
MRLIGAWRLRRGLVLDRAGGPTEKPVAKIPEFSGDPRTMGVERRQRMVLYRCEGNRSDDSVAAAVSPGGLAMTSTARWTGAAVAVSVLMLGPGYPLAAPPIPTSGYTIGPADLLDVTVWNNAGISRTVPVRPDGKISLPLLDDVQAAGLTPKQLKDNLARKLARYITSPEVSVIVREIHSLRVAVLGEVNKPGRYDLKSRASILDAIALAGGFSPYAARSKLVILRVAGSTVTRIPCNYDKIVAADVEPESFFLQPGDTLVVR